MLHTGWPSFEQVRQTWTQRHKHHGCTSCYRSGRSGRSRTVKRAQTVKTRQGVVLQGLVHHEAPFAVYRSKQTCFACERNAEPRALLQLISIRRPAHGLSRSAMTGIWPIMDRSGKVARPFSRFLVLHQAKQLEAKPPLYPAGPFQVIVADPPWRYERERSAVSDYGT